MTDDPNAVSSSRKGLLNRDFDGRKSYFFEEQVTVFQSEQSNVLGSVLAAKEKEAQITYKKFFADQICTNAQNDAIFVQLMSDSDASMNMDKLIADLRLAIGDHPNGKDVTRLLDLLYICRQSDRLIEEQKNLNAPYDLYDPEEKGRMTTFYKLSSETSDDSSPTKLMAMAFSMFASGLDEFVSSALLIIANDLSSPWDAVVLSRYFFGANSEVTKRMSAIWREAVMNRDDFRMIKLTFLVNKGDLWAVANDLFDGATNKHGPTDLFNAYRCMAIALHNAAKLPVVKRNQEVAVICNFMRTIYATFVGWGRLKWARQMLADYPYRAPIAGIPSYICHIGLHCHLELNELLLRSQGLTEEPVPGDGWFKLLGQRWRSQVYAEDGQLRTMRADTPELKQVLYEWMLSLGTSMRMPFIPYVVEKDMSLKMECAFVGFGFLHELLRWAVIGDEKERLQLIWPDGISFVIFDESIIVPDVTSGLRNLRVRTISEESTSNDNSNKKKSKKKKRKSGKSKEELPAVSTRGGSVAASRIGDRPRQPLMQAKINKPTYGASGDRGNQQRRGNQLPRSSAPSLPPRPTTQHARGTTSYRGGRTTSIYRGSDRPATGEGVKEADTQLSHSSSNVGKKAEQPPSASQQPPQSGDAHSESLPLPVYVNPFSPQKPSKQESLPLPVYVNPFEPQQPANAQLHSQQVQQQQPATQDGTPGTGNWNRPQSTRGEYGRPPNQHPGYQGLGYRNQGSRGGRGGRGGHGGGGDWEGAQNGGNQENRGSGDGHQKSSFGAQDVRGRGGRGIRGFSN